MENNGTFNLIEGTFSFADARYLLLSCLNERIVYCNRALLRARLQGGNKAEIEHELKQLENKKRQVNSILEQKYDAEKEPGRGLTVSFKIN